MDELATRDHHRHTGMNPWRAGCAETRTSGSEGGPEKRAGRNPGTALRSDPYTHFTRARRAALAIIDVVSCKWIATLVCAEESSIQVEVAFTAALHAEDLLGAADTRATAALRAALLSGDRDRVAQLTGDGTVPLLLAISDNGPQMRSVSTREFLAGVTIAQQCGRPHTPEDQAWIETLFGHVKGEWPHLEKIRDPGKLRQARGRARRGRPPPTRVQHRAVARRRRLRHS